MSYKVMYSDVLEYDGDAVLNSLGLNASIHGRLCKTLLDNVKDEEIVSFINAKTKNKVGEIFVTGGGKLPAKNIIHIVTPFRSQDTADLILLQSAYRNVIEFAERKGWKSIGLPFIGTGANGYSEAEAYLAVTKVCGELDDREEDANREILDVTVIAYLNTKPYQKMLADYFGTNLYAEREERFESSARMNRNVLRSPRPNLRSDSVDFSRKQSFLSRDERIEECSRIEPEGILCNMYYGKPEEDLTMKPNNIVNKFILALNRFEPYETFEAEVDRYKVPYDYVEDYLSKFGIDERMVLRDKGISKSRKYQMKKQKSLSKIDIYRISFALDFNFSQVVAFMVVCGVMFSPMDPVDKFFYRYIRGKLPKVNTFYELDCMAGDIFENRDSFSGDAVKQKKEKYNEYDD